MKYVILGAGAWGTALATVLHANGHEVLMWAREPQVVDDINQQHTNSRYLPGIPLGDTIKATTDLAQAICQSEWVFEAIPVQFLREVLTQTMSCFSEDQTWVITSKGIEQKTLMLPSQIIDDVFEYKTKQVVIAGPSFAHDLAQQQPTGIAVAAQDCTRADRMQKLMANDYFSLSVSLDMMGVQAGAALKNVITLGVGMLDGAGYTDNAKALLFTRGLQEMVQLGISLGAERETFYGLSGVGDMVLTAMGQRSRNLEVGKRLGRGQTLEDILRETGYIPEGINTVQSVHQLIQRERLDLPICDALHQIIFGDSQLDDLVTALMQSLPHVCKG